MIQGVVAIYKDHRNLALTLRDSQQMVNKLGTILGGLILFALMFTWLAIWGFELVSMSITFSSTLVRSSAVLVAVQQCILCVACMTRVCASGICVRSAQC
jgi:hypothetical protein